MRTWFTELFSQANERLLTESELERLFVYFDSFPHRLGAIEELERIENDLRTSLLSGVRSRYPDRALYDKHLVNDIVGAIRVAAQAMLADEPQLIRDRWVDHALQICATLDVPRHYVGDLLTEVRSRLERDLSKDSMDVLSPYLNELTKRFAA